VGNVHKEFRFPSRIFLAGFSEFDAARTHRMRVRADFLFQFDSLPHFSFAEILPHGV
jgi:hypothetical protein